MSERMIHLTFTPLQANSLAIALKMVKEMIALPPNAPVYPNLGDFQLERELIKAQVNDTQEILLKQLEEQMPKE